MSGTPLTVARLRIAPAALPEIPTMAMMLAVTDRGSIGWQVVFQNDEPESSKSRQVKEQGETHDGSSLPIPAAELKLGRVAPHSLRLTSSNNLDFVQSCAIFAHSSNHKRSGLREGQKRKRARQLARTVFLFRKSSSPKRTRFTHTLTF